MEEWENPDSYAPSFNIAPTQLSPILTGPEHRIVRPMRWGLIPGWAKDSKIGARMINARMETLVEKPSFRTLVSTNRCVVIADGYYEWQKTDTGKQPFYFRSAEGKLLPMAGLWDRWKAPDGTEWKSYTIITTEARSDLKHIHNRMPAILPLEHLQDWLDTKRYSFENVERLLRMPEVQLEFFPVSARVNSVKENSANCIERLDG